MNEGKQLLTKKKSFFYSGGMQNTPHNLGQILGDVPKIMVLKVITFNESKYEGSVGPLFFLFAICYCVCECCSSGCSKHEPSQIIGFLV